MELTRILRRFRRDNPRWVVLLIDLCMVVGCYYMANFIVNSFKGRFDFTQMFTKSLVIIAAYASSFWYFKTHKGIVRQAGIQDAMKIMIAVFSALIILMSISLVYRAFFFNDSLKNYLNLSFAVLVMHAFLTTVFLFAARVIYRQIYEALFMHRRGVSKVMIFGAGNMGTITLNLLRNDPRQKYKVVAFADDKPGRIGKMINGYQILDQNRLTEEYVASLGIESIIIALDDNSKERINRITDAIERLPVRIKIMPSSAKLLSGQAATRQLRTLNIEDLLGRAAIRLDNPIVRHAMDGKVVMVTGGAGSIGSELVRQISFTNFAKLIVLDQAESALYDIQQELKHISRDTSRFIVGNVRDEAFMRSVFEKYRPELIFHAAAYKHVPLMENNPYEAVRTNVCGTKILTDLAHEFGVDKFVMVSTDKAVNPTNVMGSTKRIAEIYVSAINKLSKTNYIVTRFGNVLGSNGSVIPLFEKQLKKGGPLTVTHPDITRYFMTIPEACQLVQEAGVMGNGGEIFVFDMGKPVRIFDLAVRMIRLKGFRYPEDISIQFTGLREGEKIFEELLADDENTKKTHHEKIMIANVNTLDVEAKYKLINHLCLFTEKADPVKSQMDIVGKIKNIVPEFVSKNSKFERLDSIGVSDTVITP